ncbi:MAG: DUF1015 domain-containing protein [Armatimonadetes bacterium]|nr:DUF1015 domain-containing protein [Armatimonadota bacterium]
MATVRPLSGQRYSTAAGPLEDLVAPPYDVISAAERQEFAAQSANNTVWLTLPEHSPDDRSKFVKYARSASRLTEWRREGILQVDEIPCLYRYRQTFTNPVDGELLIRESLICLIKVEPYERGVVLPHEQTFPKHKEDRLRLLEATGAHLECIYGLYEDAGHAVGLAIHGAPFGVIATVQTEDGIAHELAKCDSEAETAAICRSFDNEQIWIADGHHRYETAVTFRQSLRDKPGNIAEDFMLIALSSMSDPGLLLLPTHRIVKNFQTPLGQVESKLQTRFKTRTIPNVEIPDELRRLHNNDCRVFGMAMPGGSGFIMAMEEPRDALTIVEGPSSDLLKMLDVTILHEIIFKGVFGIEGIEQIDYTRSSQEAVERVAMSSGEVAFLMNPPSVEDMRRIALGGEKMPQKSTFYYPKLLSGLVFWSHSDFK